MFVKMIPRKINTYNGIIKGLLDFALKTRDIITDIVNIVVDTFEKKIITHPPICAYR